MKNFLFRNWIVLTIGTALIASMVMAIKNKTTIDKNSELQQQSERVKQLTKEILSETMHGLDLGLRGFALSKEDKMLIPFRKAIEQNGRIFNELEQLLKDQQYPNLSDLQLVKNEVQCISHCLIK